MKRFRILCVLLTGVLLLSACGTAPSATTASEKTAEATGTAEPAPSTKPAEESKYPAISHPTTRAMVEDLPIATPEMSEDDLRKLCVDYMLLQTGIVWTPKVDVTYPYESAGSADKNGMLTLNAGIRYGGLPYCKAAGNLDNFLDYYDEETGIFDNEAMKNSFGDLVGNNCGTSVYWAWARVSSTINYYGTRMMVPAHGCYPLGPYTFNTSIDTFREQTTPEICKLNGEQTMFESYALAKPATGVTTDFVGAGGVFQGHARMVVEPAHVVRNANGTINGQESYLICAEQDSGQETVQNEDGTVRAIGATDHKYTFAQLFKSNYVPVEIAELTGRSPVQKASASLDLDGKEIHSLDELAGAKVTANYAISRLNATFTDKDGKVVKESFYHGSCKNTEQYTLPLNKVCARGMLIRALTKGETYTVTISVRLGNGETLPVLETEITF